jgi:homocitrate synthase NifV
MGNTKISLSDTTLRDGEQSYGIVFNDSERNNIAHALNELGIAEIEVGFPAVPKERTAYIDTLVEERQSGLLQCRLIGWHRPIISEIIASADRGLDGCAISVPSSPALLKNVLNKDENWVMETMVKAVNFAKQQQLYVVADYQDAFAADPDFIIRLSKAMLGAGADRIRLCDTVGRAIPSTVCSLMEELWKEVDVDFEIHAHNDLGLAVANCVNASQLFLSMQDSGAISEERQLMLACTVNALGERAGNSALEILAVALQHGAGIDAGIDTRKLAKLCSLVSRASNRPIPLNAPIVGLNNWRHASGLHADGIKKSKDTYELLRPGYVGHADGVRIIACGQYGGSSALKFQLSEIGIPIPEAFEAGLLNEVCEAILIKKAYLDSAELREIADKYAKKQSTRRDE